MERRLGRGLGSLLSQDGGDAPAQDSPSEVAIALIRPNPHQPRKHFDEDGIAELRASVEQHGVLQPLVLRRVAGGFELIAGERRLRASQLAGLAEVPAVIRDDVSDEQMLEFALVENVQRRDLDPMERANAFAELGSSLGLTQADIADRVGLKRSTVANHLRLLDLPEQVQQLVAQRQISMGHAKALLGARKPKLIKRLAGDAVRKDMSVRELEAAVRASIAEKSGAKKLGESLSTTGPAGADETTPAWQRELQARLTEALGTKVEIRNGSNYAGTIAVHYYDREQLERLVGELAPRSELD